MAHGKGKKQTCEKVVKKTETVLFIQAKNDWHGNFGSEERLPNVMNEWKPPNQER